MPELESDYVTGGWRCLLRGRFFRSGFFRGGSGGFLFSVPLTEPPSSGPDLNLVRLKETWPHGRSCGACSQCCDLIGCPLKDQERGRCLGYDSIYWRYFNCGRFPDSKKQLDYYGCPKWEMR